MFASIALAALMSSAPAPSAYCLQQVAALTNETISMSDTRMVEATTAKYGRMYEAVGVVLRSQAETNRAMIAYLEKVRTQETDGELPRGSYDVEKTRIESEDRNRRATFQAQQSLLDRCEWPEAPTA